MNSGKFIAFLKKLHADAGEPIIVIADNASGCGSGRVQKFALESEEAIHLGYLPKDAPELNPDERVWNHAKARLARLFVDTAEAMKQSLLNTIRSLQKQRNLIQSIFPMGQTSYAL